MRFHLDGLEVFFPYDFVYKEQYTYMLELKRALDARGDAILEMPTGTGKTVSLLALITSYQLAHPEAGKLIYCTRTVPEMTKAMNELKRVIGYRAAELAADYARDRKAAEAMSVAESAGAAAPTLAPDILAVCLSSRRNMCIHPDVVGESGEREAVDAACRSMTASWVRARAASGEGSGAAPPKLCDYFETYERTGSDAELTGIYNLDDLKALGAARGWCPYFLARHVLAHANVIVFNYQYMLDPKIAALVSRELEDKSIVVFDEAHNIDNVCIEALSVSLDRRALDVAARNLTTLGNEVKRMKQEDAQRLQDEYARLVNGLADGAGGSGGGSGAHGGVALLSDMASEQPGAPVLPADLLREAVPGSIRNAELFVRFMKHFVQYLREKIKVAAVVSEAPSRFLHEMGAALAIDVKPLRFAYSRLNSLLRTLQVTATDDFTPLQLVADFATLLATYPVGFMVITEPYAPKTPHIADPVMQLCCLDSSLAIRPVFQKFQSVVLTSGTLSPLDMYPKMLNFNPVVRASLEMSIARPCICPLVVSRGADQTPISSKFELRGDRAVVRNSGALLVQLCTTVPDGVVAFFPSYGYMETTIAAWHEMGILLQLEAQKLLFIETKDIVETTLSLNNYKRACDLGRGALFLSVARGKVAEGIDFDRHYGRCVAIFGIPFQYTLSHVLRARLVYLRDAFAIREQDFLTFDAIRQAAQCVGRIIRSKRDYGVIVFADKRYAAHDKRSKLPQWVLQFMPDAHVNLDTNMAVHIARKFLKEMAQPLPEGAEKGTAMLSAADLRGLAAVGGAASAGAAAAGGGAYGGASAPASAALAAASRPAAYGLRTLAAGGASFSGADSGDVVGNGVNAGANGASSDWSYAAAAAAAAAVAADEDGEAAAGPPARRRRVEGLLSTAVSYDDKNAASAEDGVHAYALSGSADSAPVFSAEDVAMAEAMCVPVHVYVAEREAEVAAAIASVATK